MKINGDVKALFIFVTMLFIFSDSFILECPPVKEGADVIVKTYIPQNQNNTVTNEIRKLVFYRDDSEICSCSLINDHICYNKIQNVSKDICVTNNQTSDKFNTTIKLLTIPSWNNISSKIFSNNTWKVNFGNVNETCDIKFYAFRGKPECYSNISSEYLKIMCYLNNVFPQAKCDLKVTPYENVTISATLEYNVPAGDYYNSSCIFNLSMPENVTYKGKVTMYPNITDDKSDLQYGQSAEITFSDSQVTPIETSTIQRTNQTTSYSRISEINIVLVLTASVVCLLLFITVAVIVTFLIIRRRKGYIEEDNCCTCSWLTSNYKFLCHNKKVTEINNTMIYTLTLPRLKSNIGDSYSNVNKLQLSGFTVCHSDDLNTAILKVTQSKTFDAGYENCTSVTGVNLQNKEKQPDIYFNGDIIKPSVTNIKH
ncbi:uncharacterized protein LOC129924087 [Biomphalaria glabrata]|uniref:Uncharacterized protein LOC129922840 isoform X1 n=1 Tax=Biomphalaria glabrata TaxID=6526 RepID=A0A9W2ZG17_BIOGL|nr:uncharacterized protein LOC129922840 isoform X1 [Biomphalaria glabrata]XP_055866502.1 uncharacterized protein LOC129922840 isoform X1 [Biomphalaria glabrata]XP_055866503.1 uncharacterized protein LOC129922840 isoform X1 [Biomphalaria glabrata]XP_055866505.1 uncharacterized protein LOC129922840 isoform X1 [Biomphalaria glabrata]XP_055873873.1 uncharacterized protein LOC129924087 [Biomphalaria glabrata]